MVKGRFTFPKTEQGTTELETLIKQLSPLLGHQSRIKVRDDDSRPYKYVYLELFLEKKL